MNDDKSWKQEVPGDNGIFTAYHNAENEIVFDYAHKRPEGRRSVVFGTHLSIDEAAELRDYLTGRINIARGRATCGHSLSLLDGHKCYITTCQNYYGKGMR